MNIVINDSLFKRLEELKKKSAFKEVEELVDFILEEYLKNIQDSPPGISDSDILNERLKNLGYL